MARFTPYSYRGKVRGGGQPLIEPTKETIDAFEQVIRWAEQEVPTQLKINMLKLTQVMAFANQGFARKMSFGPEDPTGRNTSLAWRIPVRRISSRYYLGWKVKEVPNGWMVYNDSREAYYIEFGINWRGEGRRVRRPILRLSLLKTLEFMATTQAYHRIWSEIFKHHRSGMGFGFTQIVQSPTMGSYTGPMLGRTLP